MKKLSLLFAVLFAALSASAAPLWMRYPAISPDGKQAVQLKLSDYGKYDLFIGMDSANIRNMHVILGGDPEKKIRKMMDYTARPGDVADPWYVGHFDVTYRDIYEACDGLLKTLM